MMVESGRFRHFFGVDVYGDNHDTGQYKEALRQVGLFAPYTLLRMRFEEALDLFDDESLDFVYVDGFASTGQMGGKTIYDWSRKVRVGGVIAGDDFHSDWPLVVRAVEAFAEDTGFELCVTTEIEPDSRYNDYPSWAMVKTKPFAGQPPAELLAEGQAAAQRLMRKRASERRMSDFLKRLVGPERFENLRQWNRSRKARRR